MQKRSLLRRVLFFGMEGRWGIRISIMLCVIIFIELRAPAALAFPYKHVAGSTVVYSEQPIEPRIQQILARSDGLLRASPINDPGIERKIVLTSGGWRWRVLALNSSGSVAFRRPFSNVLILNRSDIVSDRVTNGAPVGGMRTISGTIAHETVHLLLAHHLGEFRAMRLPTWKQEGYADYIGGETSVDPRDEQRIRDKDPKSAVLRYYEGRRRVAAFLERGGSFNALMAP